MSRRAPGSVEGASASAGAPSVVSPNLSDPNDPFYSYQSLMKKNHLKIQEIYQYQGMDTAQIGSIFFQLGVQKGADLFYLMLQSFKIAARVANAAWGLFETLRCHPDILEEVDRRADLREELTKVGRALNDYSPDNFAPHMGDLEFAADCFEQFYNEVAALETKEQVEERLFEWTKMLKEKLAERAEGMQKLTVDDVVNNAKRKRKPVTASSDEG